jgi:murein DD-endopeptidase MepM/ murein hydrolase activator NlpD
MTLKWIPSTILFSRSALSDRLATKVCLSCITFGSFLLSDVILEVISFVNTTYLSGHSSIPSVYRAAQAQAQQTDDLCPKPALDRLTSHKVSAGETLDSIAKQYKLVPATIMGLNPVTRDGQVKPGEELLIPPYNGIRIEVPAGSLIKDIARQYKVRADVLFELNGCQPSPRVVFVPGVNWSPNQGTAAMKTESGSSRNAPTFSLGYPLAQPAEILLGYGWKQRSDGQVALHSGIDFSAAIGTPVIASADGTVAFAGVQAAYGNLIVINHAQGYQTRYAQLEKISVKVGQTVKKGTSIGFVGNSGTPSSEPPHLHFEVRSNSKLGWVAEDPNPLLR